MVSLMKSLLHGGSFRAVGPGLPYMLDQDAKKAKMGVAMSLLT